MWKNDLILFEKITGKSPNAVSAHNNLGLVYAGQGRFDEAIEEYLIALKLKPTEVNIHYNLGLAYKKKGLSDEAKKKFEIVLKLKPDFTEAQKALKHLNE